MREKYYLAYGSNLNIDQMTYRCPDAVPVGVAEIRGYRLMYKGSKTGSYLTIEKEKGCYVPVGVWEVSEADEDRLDTYEGYPNFYYKKEITVTVHNFDGEEVCDRKVKAFVYIMHEERPYGVPTKRYVDTCRQGYEDFGFDMSILNAAYDYSKEKVVNSSKRYQLEYAVNNKYGNTCRQITDFYDAISFSRKVNGKVMLVETDDGVEVYRVYYFKRVG